MIIASKKMRAGVVAAMLLMVSVNTAKPLSERGVWWSSFFGGWFVAGAAC